MTLAQRLYEAGHITYMRTDSTNLSAAAVEACRSLIGKDYGDLYLPDAANRYSSKEGAQEAHEAIRPTDFHLHSGGADRDQTRLYELIWKRAIASQMSDAKLERTNVTIAADTHDKNFTASGEVVKFEGFLKVYLEGTDDEEDDTPKGILPPLSKDEAVNTESIVATQRFTHHPPRYTEASLVKKLEELGIGRPSTYAPTISTIQKRGYVEKKERDGAERSYQVYELKENNLDQKTTASTQRDIMEGKPSELENFNGYIVKEGNRLNIPTPVNQFVYECLLPMEKQSRKQLESN
jgi:DNA topoisomerase-1